MQILSNLDLMIRHQPILAFGAVYAAGVATSFTPCVYPIIPLTLGVIGAKSSGSKRKGFAFSIAYVLGMALSYAALGAFAALSGTLFGRVSTSPWTYFLVANTCLLFGFSMITGFVLPQFNILPPSMQKKRHGFFGVLLMGILAGLIVGPCTAPVLGTLLVFVGTKQNILYGFMLLLTFGFGIGLLFILLGTFTGLLSAMPKSGAWLERVKMVFGWVLVFTAEYLFVKMGGLL